jgi:AraC family transcriptional regulator, activator of mtrCDE
MIPVRGLLDYRCFLGAPWRIDFPASELGEMPYHVILGGSAVLDDPEGGPTRKLIAGDILLLSHGSAYALHDGSDARRSRPASEPRSTSCSTRMTEPGIGST